MTKKEVAQRYIELLEQGDTQNIITLFSTSAKVHSPIYGSKSAQDFYIELSQDTKRSELKLNGIFEEEDSNRLAIYFIFKWTLKNDKIITFDVVDILEFDNQNKIEELKIIYDTVITRPLVDQLEK